jgi:hypothetical protein
MIVHPFIEKLGLRPLMEESFNDSVDRRHSYASIVEQLIYTTIAGYHCNDASDNLRYNPIFASILDKDALASPPTEIYKLIEPFSQYHYPYGYKRIKPELFMKQ